MLVHPTVKMFDTMLIGQFDPHFVSNKLYLLFKSLFGQCDLIFFNSCRNNTETKNEV